MIDGRGRAKITDFGLASLAQVVEGDEVRADTPQYMSPEQHAGKEVSVRSDIYALGLVLYELFTGKRAFEAATTAEIMRLQEQSTPTSPSTHVEGLDPAVERIILGCLEKEPARRPDSALSVAAALPGGDPLAAALAAGEIPSPDMVANAGGEGALKPSIAVACLVFFVLFLALLILRDNYFPHRVNLYNYVPLDKPPEVLIHDAQGIIERLCVSENVADIAYGYAANSAYLTYIQENDSSPDRWERLHSAQPSAMFFWYRQSPRLLFPERGLNTTVDARDPPFEVSGMVSVELDLAGRLRFLRVVPPQVDEGAKERPEPAWPLLFEAAGLELDAFASVEPTWVPKDFCDARAAWEGFYPTEPEMPIRIEAGAFRGRLSSFEIIEPWRKPERMEQHLESLPGKAVGVIFTTIFIAIMAGAILLARRNLRLGRGDRRGASRLALFAIALGLVEWVLIASHAPNFFAEFAQLMDGLIPAVAVGCLVWLIYVALEPFLRRRWPEALVSWNRVLTGRLRDPRVGRDILAGAVGIGLLGLLNILRDLPQNFLDYPFEEPGVGVNPDFLLGTTNVLNLMNTALGLGVLLPILLLFVLLLLRIVFRKQWIAFGALVALCELFVLVAFYTAGISEPISIIVVLVHQLLLFVIVFFLFRRFGLLSLCAFFFLSMSVGAAKPPLDLTAWYGRGSATIMLITLVFVGWAFYISIGGLSRLGGGLVPEE
jgi:serine/threonine-protein kinase